MLHDPRLLACLAAFLNGPRCVHRMAQSPSAVCSPRLSLDTRWELEHRSDEILFAGPFLINTSKLTALGRGLHRHLGPGVAGNDQNIPSKKID